MLVRKVGKTGWFHLSVVVALTITSFYFISEALAKPAAEWQTFNEIRAKELQQALQ